VKIVVSGGFTVDKIREFERQAACRWTPTAWARRSSAGRFDFTADVVRHERDALREGRAGVPAQCETRAGDLIDD
jgi:hypothetical protein